MLDLIEPQHSLLRPSLNLLCLRAFFPLVCHCYFSLLFLHENLVFIEKMLYKKVRVDAKEIEKRKEISPCIPFLQQRTDHPLLLLHITNIMGLSSDLYTFKVLMNKLYNKKKYINLHQQYNYDYCYKIML